MAPHIGEKAQEVTRPALSMAAIPIALTGSPFNLTIPRNGILFISGGTLSALQYSRGTSINVLGATTNQLFVMAGDQIRFSYVLAPTLTLLPI